MNKRRLGRGLEALLGREEGGFEASALDACELIQIAVDQIDPNPFQPRRVFNPDEIASLADSLRQHGMLQPVLVRTAGERFQLIAGERRLRASIEAQLHEVPARVLALDDQRVFELAMVENLQREDLNAVDKASAFREYLSRYGGTQEELAGRLGVDRSTVSNLIRLLELPGEVLDAVRTSEISQGHARALLALSDHEVQVVSCRRIITEHLSVRQTEALVTTGAPTPSRPRLRKDPAHSHDARAPHFLALEQRLGDVLGTTVAVRSKTVDRGQIVIDFQTREEFDRIAVLLQQSTASTAS
jgi:ParB family transcriptional regulator, chromosome partitioning protein